MKKFSDQELANQADMGLRGQGALVEMMSRLKYSIDKLEKSTTFYSRWLVFLTIILTLLTLILLF
ncbi:MAG: hypothetical protein UY06_C0013G0009 [Candidatus Amesbacteria bacterium GW2011_GWA2_47_70]|nr:MAG: hypothetical protein UY06_C0013G0009 [Candidatus Amesbacteria bacterium GW2011_GWA2_47_70]